MTVKKKGKYTCEKCKKQVELINWIPEVGEWLCKLCANRFLK